MIREIPKTLKQVLLLLTALALLPPAVIAFVRTFPSSKPPVHLIQDMDNQAKFRAQQPNDFFADGRAMRQPIPGTVARGELQADEHYVTGQGKTEGGKTEGGGKEQDKTEEGETGPGEAEQGETEQGETGRVKDAWADTFPQRIEVSLEFVKRGRKRYGIYCLPCHGPAGYGNGMIDTRAKQLLVNTRRSLGTSWVPPANLHLQAIANQPIGQIFNTITHGLNTMRAYGPQIPVHDRWAIVAYVKALQKSQNAKLEDLPPDQRDAIPEVAEAPEEPK